MLNDDSYWLYNGENKDKEWAFMYDNRVNDNFSNEFPNEWTAITKNKTGSLITAKGLFCFSNILTNEEFAAAYTDYSICLGEGDWYIISYIPSASQKGELLSKNNTGDHRAS